MPIVLIILYPLSLLCAFECFFQGADKFEARYATLGFNDAANLDDGDMWPTAFALKGLTEAEEVRITELVRKATS